MKKTQYEDKFLQELQNEFEGVHDLLCPEEEERERQKSASVWVKIAKKRGHGLSLAEESALNI